MYGPSILVRTLSSAGRRDRFNNHWQYHSRSDHHSKVACWGVVFDLMATTPLLRRHVAVGAVCFGINHEMRDFVHDRKKNLDLVLCTPGSAPANDSLASKVSMNDAMIAQCSAPPSEPAPAARACDHSKPSGSNQPTGFTDLHIIRKVMPARRLHWSGLLVQ